MGIRGKPIHLAALALAVLFTGFPVPAAAAPDPGNCKPYVFLGARGSGEPSPLNTPGHPDVGRYGVGGLGKVLTPEFQKLKDLLGDSHRNLVEARFVPYEAFSALDWKPSNSELFGLVVSKNLIAAGAGAAARRAARYDRSVKAGVDQLTAELENLVRFCPKSTKVVLGGYSQGAHLVGNALEKVRDRRHIRDRILGVSLFGDPLFNPLASAKGDFDPTLDGLLGSRNEFPSDLRSGIASWCYAGDWICQGVGDLRDGLAASKIHGSYGSSAAILEALRVFQLIRANEAAKKAAVPGAPSPLSRPVDVSFVVDSTGSMSEAIESVKDNLQIIRNRLAASATSLSTALVDYKDEPTESSDYQSRLVSPLTEDAGAFARAVDSLEAEGGGDTPESVFAGIATGLSVAWRPDATKFVLLVGDAPPKDPEPLTSLTEAAITAAALRVPASIYSLTVGDDMVTRDSFTRLSSATFGRSYDVEDPSTVASSIIAAIDFQATVPTLSVAASRSGARISATPVDAAVGERLRFSTATSESPVGESLTFAWDFGDGSQLTTERSVVGHIWKASFSGDVKVTVTDQSGRSAQALLPIQVAGKSTASPAKLAPPRVKSGTRAVLVRWKASRRGRPSLYEVRADGRLVGIVDPSSGGAHGLRLRVPWPALGNVVRFTVRAVDRLGRGVISKPSRLVTKPSKGSKKSRRPGKRTKRRP